MSKPDTAQPPFAGAFPAFFRCFAAASLWVSLTVAGVLHAAETVTVQPAYADGSLQLQESRPVMSYTDGVDGLKFAACVADCLGGAPKWVFSQVDKDPTAGGYNALKLDAGRPVVAYQSWDLSLAQEGVFQSAVKVATCLRDCATETPAWVIDTVDTGPALGFDISLQLRDGHPVVSYYDMERQVLKLATCTLNCATGRGTWVVATVDGAGDVGAYSSLQLNQGRPVISYHDQTRRALKLATCTAGCETAAPRWVIGTVDAGTAGGNIGSGVGEYTSLQLNGGRPVVAYYDRGNQRLKLATCTAHCGSAGAVWSIAHVDRPGDNGRFPTLRLVDGFPVIAYSRNRGGDLTLALCTERCAGADPAWRTADIGAQGYGNSLQLDGAAVRIAFADHQRNRLGLATTELLSLAHDFQGSWWTSSGEAGWAAWLAPHGSVLGAGWYETDAGGRLTWTIVPACGWNADRVSCEGTAYRSVASWFGNGAPADLANFDNVGTVRFRFQDPGRGVVEFTGGDGSSFTRIIARAGI